MNRFIANHADKITGVLSGFDRIVCHGTLRPISYVGGLKRLLWNRQVLLKDFGDYAEGLTDQLREASLRAAQQQGRPVQYLPLSDTDKEAVALRIAQRDGIKSGLIAVLTCIEPCTSFDIFKNRDANRLELVSRFRKGLALYHYLIDPIFGFMHARIQSWLPFTIQICMNGREWLARTMDRAGLSYRRRDNCFVQLEDTAKAQALMNQQVHFAWTSALDRFARLLNPAHPKCSKTLPWTTTGSPIKPNGPPTSCSKTRPPWPPSIPRWSFTASPPSQAKTSCASSAAKFTAPSRAKLSPTLKNRPEGVRIKHRVGSNSVKLYDKQGSVLRAETTINQPYGFKVFRRTEGDPVRPQILASPYAKASPTRPPHPSISQASNNRYLDALASVDTSTPLGELLAASVNPSPTTTNASALYAPGLRKILNSFKPSIAASSPSTAFATVTFRASSWIPRRLPQKKNAAAPPKSLACSACFALTASSKSQRHPPLHPHVQRPQHPHRHPGNPQNHPPTTPQSGRLKPVDNPKLLREKQRNGDVIL